MRKYAKTFILILILISIPVGLFAADPSVSRGGFIPCDGPDCDFEDLLTLVNNVLDWLVMISFSAAIITFSWAGFILLTSGGDSGKKDQAKKMLWSVIKGFTIMLGAWLIVNTITRILLK